MRLLSLLPAVLLLSVRTASASGNATSPDLEVHEWGTFTSVVIESGPPIVWNTLGSSEPLPSFVHGSDLVQKGFALGTVRMETPVLYFRTSQTQELRVGVELVGGKITEWYPAAEEPPGGGIQWPRVIVDPSRQWILPTELQGQHYYAARGVAAAQVEVPVEPQRSEFERFLFYRGVGSFALPLSARLEGERVIVRSECSEQIDQVLLFERRGDRFHYAIECYLGSGQEVAFERPESRFQPALHLDDLKKILRGQGLREDEAQAMVDTWRADWFQPGLRVFYTVPREFTDRVLPLTIEPAPDHLVRVLMGRVEIFSQSVADEILSVARRLGRPGAPRDEADRLTRLHGRFVTAVLGQQAVLSDPTLLPGLQRWTEQLAALGER